MPFPKNFLWGTATSAGQIEGGAFEDGRTPSIWDTFAAKPGKTHGGGLPTVACDSYHRYPEDIALMKQHNIRAYRFSISWARVMPDGDGPLNEAGLAYYDDLVNRLLENGIEPMVTLYHWDLPSGTG